jgi:type IV secretion system protein TrbC
MKTESIFWIRSRRRTPNPNIDTHHSGGTQYTMKLTLKKTAFSLASLLVPSYILEATDSALASAVTTGGSLPWEGPMSTLATELTGPTASTIAIIAIFVAGLALIFGEDLGKFARTLLMIVIAIAFLVGASRFIAPLTGGLSF